MAEADLGPRFQGRDDAKVNPLTLAKVDRFSTFSIDIDTAAYSIARRSLIAERMPTPSLVRVEEFVNFFRYGYELPPEDGVFAVEATGSRSPIDPSKHLVRIGVQARTIDEVDRKPVNLVFLVDTSGSMAGRDKLALAQRALSVAVERLDERDQVAITTYAGGVRLVLPPTSGAHKSEILRALRRLKSGGGTAMGSGMQLAYSQARVMMSGEDEVTRVIVCSDGDANIGATSPDAILETVGQYVKDGIRMSTIGFGQGNYHDYMIEQLANRGNGNYFYIDSMRQAERVFGRDLFKMLEDVAQDVKIQVEFDSDKVAAYRLIGYENRDIADEDFRNDAVDAGEIGAGHQVTALYEVLLAEEAVGKLANIRVRAKRPGGEFAKEVS
ncbi:MAG: von Willebrand factor type A domain-containing protein, partial [Myxococcota bacterium]